MVIYSIQGYQGTPTNASPAEQSGCLSCKQYESCNMQCREQRRQTRTPSLFDVKDHGEVWKCKRKSASTTIDAFFQQINIKTDAIRLLFLPHTNANRFKSVVLVFLPHQSRCTHLLKWAFKKKCSLERVMVFVIANVNLHRLLCNYFCLVQRTLPS